MGRVLGALIVMLLCAACGRADLKTADGLPSVLPTGTPTETPPPTVPTSLSPAGPCQVEEKVPEPVVQTVPPAQPTGGATPDVAPHNAENSRWKQRKPLNAKGVQTGRDTIARVRPVLERVCGSGDFSVDATKKALSGYEAYVIRPYERETFVGFTITVSNGPTERVTCLIGDLKPGLVRIFVDGTTGEGDCYEPKSH
ncbi:hypothetical protein SK803_16825 [Lentzea sp. BCCO 10_0856]|uniref:Uncharacterized protein n=1 Tax=Lentzea miocenica TaxID=3095431 RepID=A0ABU4T160_9PSEU|nr:hypothetical protein [Lentzea sp. BCCO 10_0856]MDX8031890.1 hypothetical protein [Lentzea sp. BCCO 10_0856]